MAGKLPLFASAPLCKIDIDTGSGAKTIAYAVGLSVNVSVNLQEVRVLGQYEVEAIEPLAMMPVTGSFQVIRLMTDTTRGALLATAKADPEKYPLVRTEGDTLSANTPSGIKNDSDIKNGKLATDLGAGALTGSDELAKHLDPRTILLSKSFDITVKMKTPAAKNEQGNWTEGALTTFMVLKDCRLSGASASLTPGALLTESVEFQGLLAVRYSTEGATAAPIEEKGISVNDL